MTVKTKRTHAGFYEVTDGGLTVNVYKGDAALGTYRWIAQAAWNRFDCTDPMLTKRDAMASALRMIANEQERKRQRNSNAAMTARTRWPSLKGEL